MKYISSASVSGCAMLFVIDLLVFVKAALCEKMSLQLEHFYKRCIKV